LSSWKQPDFSRVKKNERRARKLKCDHHFGSFYSGMTIDNKNIKNV
jgi:hypothetical protein